MVSGSRGSTRPGMSRSWPNYDPIYHVRCAIDAGTSRHTAAVFFQVRHNDGLGSPRVTVFGDYHALDVVSRKNAFAIKELADRLPCHGKLDLVRLDPAATARSSLGPAAYSEYEQVFGSRFVARWPRHLVLDGLETLDLLLESGNLVDPPAVLAAQGRLPDVLPPAPRRRVDRLPGRRPSRRRLDRRAPRRHPRRLPRGLGATAQPPPRSMLRGSWDEPAREARPEGVDGGQAPRGRSTSGPLLPGRFSPSRDRSSGRNRWHDREFACPTRLPPRRGDG